MAAHLLMSGFLWPLIQSMVALNDHHSYQAPQYPAHGDSALRGCGEYSNQNLANGKCKIVATLPQQDGHRCPDIFRCTDEVSYWLHENEERKQEILEMMELIAELQEELRNHRHRLRILEQQVNIPSSCLLCVCVETVTPAGHSLVLHDGNEKRLYVYS